MDKKLFNEVALISIAIVVIATVFSFFTSSCNDDALALDEEYEQIETRSKIDTSSVPNDTVQINALPEAEVQEWQSETGGSVQFGL